MVINGAARHEPREYPHLDPATLILGAACFSEVLLREAGVPPLAPERGAELLKDASIYRSWGSYYWGEKAADQPNTTAHLQ